MVEMGSLNELKKNLPKSGNCPLCLDYFKGLKIHFNTCFKKNSNNNETVDNNTSVNIDNSVLIDVSESLSDSVSLTRENPVWLQNIINCNEKYKFSLLHLNINSVNGPEKKLGLDSILNLNLIDLIFIQESKLGDDTPDSTFEYHNYSILRRDRLKGGGGIIIFYKNCYKISSILIDDNFETISFTLEINKLKYHFISSYNPHFENRLEHIEHLSSLLLKLRSDVRIVLVGDFNQDLLSWRGDDFISFINDFNFSNLVEKPTHNQQNSLSMIDLLCVNNLDLCERVDILDCPFSNHFFIHCNLNLRAVKSKPKFITARVLNEKNLYEINCLLYDEIHKFNLIDSLDDIDEKFDSFESILTNIVDSVAPLKKFRSRRVDNCAWMDKELLYALRKRDSLHARFITCGSDKLSNEWYEFKEARNYFKSLSRAKMREFYADKTLSKFKNPRDYWNFYRKVVKTKKACGNEAIASLNINDVIVSDKSDLANEFNKFFGNFNLPNIVSDYESESFVNDFFHDLKRQGKFKNLEPFSFKPVSSVIVKKLLDGLDSSSSSGNSLISVKVLKYCSELLSPILANIFNECIMKARVTKSWKFAIVTPLFKGKGANDLCDNYRGISVLQPISKIFERVLANQIVIYFKINSFLSPYQHGFREGYSCETALQSILDNWKCGIENKEIVISFFIDFKKAFDLINPKLLFLKLFHYGFDNNSLELVKHYFKERSQKTRVCDCLSSSLDLSIGVPQGSVLGPLFFLIYINDLSYSTDLFIYLFADDTTVFIRNKNLSNLISQFKAKMEIILEWIKYNQLTINWNKSKVMFFTNQMVDLPNILVIENNAVEVVNEFKLLGITIDNRLNFKKHIENIKKLVNKKIFSFKNLFFLSNCTKIQFFKTFILPHFDYCSTLIIYFSKTLIDSIEKFYKICIFRLFKISLFDLSISDQYISLKCLNLLPIKLRFFYNLCTFSYKIVNKKILFNFFEQLKIVNEQNSIRICSHKNIYAVPFARINFSTSRLSVFLPNFLNKVLKFSTNLNYNMFCQSIKSNIMIFYNKFLDANFNFLY